MFTDLIDEFIALASALVVAAAPPHHEPPTEPVAAPAPAPASSASWPAPATDRAPEHVPDFDAHHVAGLPMGATLDDVIAVLEPTLGAPEEVFDTFDCATRTDGVGAVWAEGLTVVAAVVDGEKYVLSWRVAATHPSLTVEPAFEVGMTLEHARTLDPRLTEVGEAPPRWISGSGLVLDPAGERIDAIATRYADC